MLLTDFEKNWILRHKDVFTTHPDRFEEFVKETKDGLGRDSYLDILRFLYFDADFDWTTCMSYIPANIFYGYDLKEFVIPGNCKKIEHTAFHSCFKLKELTIEQGVESIEDYAFNQCNLPKLVLPASIKYLGHECFSAAFSHDQPSVTATILSKDMLLDMTTFSWNDNLTIRCYRDSTVAELFKDKYVNERKIFNLRANIEYLD